MKGPTGTTRDSVDRSPDPSARQRRSAWLLVGLITAAGVAFRWWFVTKINRPADNLWSDMGGWVDLARTLANPAHKAELWDTLKPRATGFTGAIFYRLFAKHPLAAWTSLQVAVSGATIPLSYIGLRRWFGARPALWAAALVAGHFVYVNMASYFMSENYLIFFVALAFALLVPGRPLRALAAGVSLGLAVWYKGQAAPLLVLWAAALWLMGGGAPVLRPAGHPFRFGKWLAAWVRPRRWLTRHRVSAIALVFGALLIILPECVAVSRIAGRPAFMSTYNGSNVYFHCPVHCLFAMGGNRGGVFVACSPVSSERGERWPDITLQASVFDSTFYSAQGMSCFERSSFPEMMSWLGVQLMDTFAGVPGKTVEPWPAGNARSFAYARWSNLSVAYLVMPLAVAGLWMGRRRAGAWIGFGLPMITVLTVSVAVFGDPRYRAPYDFFAFGAACSAVEVLWARWKSGRRAVEADRAPAEGALACAAQ